MQVRGIIAVLLLGLWASATGRAQDWEKDNNAGEEALRQGHYQQAERAFADAVKEARAFPPDDLRLPSTLHNLGTTYLLESKYDDAERTLREVIDLTEKAHGPNAPLIALASDSLVRLYAGHGQLEKAIKSCERGLEVRKALLGEEQPEVATNLSNLAALYFADAKISDSRMGLEGPAIGRAPVGQAHTLGRGRRIAVERSSNVELTDRSEFTPKKTSIESTVRFDGGKLATAERYYQQALAIREKRLPPSDPLLEENLESLGKTYSAEKKFREASQTYGRLLELQQASGGADATQLLAVLDDIAEMDYHRKAYADAAQDYARDLAMREKAYGKDSPQLVETLRNFAAVLKKLDRKEEAKAMEGRAGAILASRQVTSAR